VVKLIRHYVRGAPIQVGTPIIVGLSLDETFDRSFVGREGVVVHLNYEGGTGQTFPGDPLIGVRFSDNREDDFWREELLLTTETPRSLIAHVYEQFKPIIEERVPLF
jgi:hypothetical protein